MPRGSEGGIRFGGTFGQELDMEKLASGQTPDYGASPVFREDGWRFEVPAGGVVAARLWCVVDDAAELLDLYVKISGPDNIFPCVLTLYEEIPEAGYEIDLDGIGTTTHTFTVSGESIGPTGGGSDTEYTGLSDFALPKTGSLRFHGQIVLATGESLWIFTMGDLGKDPGGSVTVLDYKVQPTLRMEYDDDVAKIVVTTPIGTKSYTGLSGGGLATYQVGVDTTSGGTESNLAPQEERSGYKVEYYGTSTSVTTFVPFSGSLHGPVAKIPALVLEDAYESSADFELNSDATAVDGYTGRSTFGTWAAITGGAGESFNTDYASTVITLKFAYGGSSWSHIRRGILLFNVAANLPEDAEVTSAVLTLHPLSTPSNNFSQSLVLTNAPVTAYTSIIAADYALLKAAPVEHGAGRKTLASIVSGTDFSFALNSTALTTLNSTIVSGNVFELGLFFSSDFDDSEPGSPPTAEDQVVIASANHGTVAFRPTLTLTYDGGYAVVILRMSDPDALVDSVEYQYKSGAADWTAWAEYLSGSEARSKSAEGDGTYIFDGSPTPPIRFGIFESPLSYAQARLLYIVGGESLYTDPIITPGFDSGKRPNLTIVATADKNWNAFCKVDGDFDTKSVKISLASGISPLIPDLATIQSETAINGRNLSVDDIAAQHDDIPYTLQPGEKAIFAAVGYSAIDAGGLESSNIVSHEVSRPTEFGGSDPQIDSLTPSAADDGTGGIDVTVTWTCSNVVDATHDMYVRVDLPPSYNDYNDATNASPDNSGAGGNTEVIPLDGYGVDGSNELPANTRFKVTIILKAGSTELDSKVAYVPGYTV